MQQETQVFFFLA